MNLALTRSRFLDNAIVTAGPQRILTMLYDRLVLDLDRAQAAQRTGDRSEAAEYLDNAQNIVVGLASTLDIAAWSDGKGLMDLYTYLQHELLSCSLAGNADRTAKCGELVIPLRDAWHEAAATIALESAPVALIPTQHTRAPAFGDAPVSGELGIG